MKKAIALSLLLFCCFTLSAQKLIVPETAVYQGDALTAFVAPLEEGQSVSFTLKDDKEKVITSSKGINFYKDNGMRYKAALLAVSSTERPQTALLEAVVSTEEGNLYFSQYITISKKDFLSETIPLSREVSGMVQTPDPRKREQSRRLWRVLNRVDETTILFWENFIPPVRNYEETSWFGDRRIFKYDDGTTSRSIHGGLDMAADTGEPMIAAGSGKIVMAEERIVTGGTVIIEHLPGIYTLYYHMDSINVIEGQRIIQGEKIGTVGATGMVTGAHLHWELKINRISVDPKRYLGRPLIDKTPIITTMGDTP